MSPYTRKRTFVSAVGKFALVQKRTCAAQLSMSAKYQKRTSPPHSLNMRTYAEGFGRFFLGGSHATVSSSNTDLISEFSDRYLWYCVTTAFASFKVAARH